MADEDVVLTLGEDEPIMPPPAGPAAAPPAPAEIDIDPTEIRDVPTLRLIGHSNQVKAVVVLGDGRVASAGADTTIRVFDPTTARQSVKIETASCVYSLALLSDGSLVAGLGDHSIVVYSIGTDSARKRITLYGHDSSIFSLASVVDANDSDVLISGSRKGDIKIWDVASGACLTTLTGHTDTVGCLLPLVSDHGHLLASGSTDNTIKLWDLATCECVATLAGHTGAVVALCRLPGQRIASASKDHTVRIWDYRRGASPVELRAHTDAVWGLVRLPGGVLVSGGDDKRVCFWDVDRGKLLAQVAHPHGPVHDMDLHPDGTLLCANHDDYSTSQYTLPPALVAAAPDAIARGLSRRAQAAGDASAAEGAGGDAAATVATGAAGGRPAGILGHRFQRSSFAAWAPAPAAAGAASGGGAAGGATTGSVRSRAGSAAASLPPATATVAAAGGGGGAVASGSASSTTPVAGHAHADGTDSSSSSSSGGSGGGGGGDRIAELERQLAAARAEAARWSAAARDTDRQLFAARSDTANLRGVIAALVKSGVATNEAAARATPSSDRAALEIVDRFTPAMQELNGRIRELQAENRALAERCAAAESKVHKLTLAGSMTARELSLYMKTDGAAGPADASGAGAAAGTAAAAAAAGGAVATAASDLLPADV